MRFFNSKFLWVSIVINIVFCIIYISLSFSVNGKLEKERKIIECSYEDRFFLKENNPQMVKYLGIFTIKIHSNNTKTIIHENQDNNIELSLNDNLQIRMAFVDTSEDDLETDISDYEPEPVYVSNILEHPLNDDLDYEKRFIDEFSDIKYIRCDIDINHLSNHIITVDYEVGDELKQVRIYGKDYFRNYDYLYIIVFPFWLYLICYPKRED